MGRARQGELEGGVDDPTSRLNSPMWKGSYESTAPFHFSSTRVVPKVLLDIEFLGVLLGG